MIGHRTRFRENNDIYFYGEVQPQRKSRHFFFFFFFDVGALITREILRSEDAQCKTGEWP